MSTSSHTPEPLPYATPEVTRSKRALTPEQIRRRQLARMITRRLLLVTLPILCVAFYVLYIGDNRWRVRFHHGVRTPASARDFWCRGATAISYWLGSGHSSALFTIDRADLPQFLSQFQKGANVPLPGGRGFITTGKPFAGPVTPDGELWGPSPTGTDYYMLKWRSTADGVSIELDTDWN